jgi:DNA-directed RNA polymerase subunit M/transcription elongation factor TFIIS
MWGFVKDLLDAADACPACGEPMIDPQTTPGYEAQHCRDCAYEIKKRRDWLNRRQSRPISTKNFSREAFDDR